MKLTTIFSLCVIWQTTWNITVDLKKGYLACLSNTNDSREREALSYILKLKITYIPFSSLSKGNILAHAFNSNTCGKEDKLSKVSEFEVCWGYMTISRQFMATKWDPVSKNYNNDNVVFNQVYLLLNSHILSEKKERRWSRGVYEKNNP